MAYVNFEEEKFVAENQLRKRKANNKKIREKMIKNKETLKKQFDETYSFKETRDRIINNTSTLKENKFLEISNKVIACADFINCKFYNIKFKECTFIACKFDECNFSGGGVSFENCSFIKVETSKTPSLNIKDNLSCEFHNCKMYVKFLNCDISYMIIEECFIHNTSFELTDMTAIIVKSSQLKMINFTDVDLSNAKFVDNYIEDFEFNDKLKSKMDTKTFFDKIKFKKKTRGEYEGIYTIYENLANKFKENNLKNNFGEYYYLCRCVQRKVLKPLPKIGSYIDWISSGYGERVIAPLITSLVIILLFAVLYLITGMEIDGEIIKVSIGTITSIDIRTLISYFNEALNLSIGFFASMGIIKAAPVSEMYILSDIEVLVGVIMMGIGIGTLTRKFVR